MKHFKKRTIALVLASVITVVGSFAASNYKNSLMSLKFDTGENGGVNMSVETKTAYTGNVSPVRRDANTYILTLSEMNSLVKGMPNIEKVSNDISSVEIKTLPYSNNAKGYTRVIIKTHNPVKIQAENKIYIPSKDDLQNALLTDDKQESGQEDKFYNRAEQEKQEIARRRAERLQREKEAREREQQQAAQTVKQEPVNSAPAQPASSYTIQPIKTTNTYDTIKETAEKDPYEVLMIVLSVLAVFGIIAFCAVRASNKLQEVTGEKIDIDTTEEKEEKPKKETKRKQIKNAIKQLDSAYSKTAVPQAQASPVKTTKPAEELNVVDLDELFKEQQEKTKEDEYTEDSEENDALAEFLSGFSFDEDETEPQEEEVTAGYDEEYYNKLINENQISFTQDDIECMKQLLNAEINDDTMSNITDYAVTNPLKVNLPSKEEILEELVTTYKISQDILFSSDDIATLRKLMSVELDNDFITDLRTNPERTLQMQQEIETSKNRTRKPSEILTLNVKDMLPDLSEALRKQGGKKIESEVKPITVYASEGYEVNTLTLGDALPDLSKEINNKEAYAYKSSADWDLVDNSYEVEKLSLSDSLPDLREALKNPEKYNSQKETPVEIDEEALLKNISNVQFKPFDDGSNNFEIINNFEAPSVDDIQNEFNQFGNFEITKEEEYTDTSDHKPYDDFEALYSNEYFDLDNIKEESKAKEEFIPAKLERKREENSIASKRVRTQLSKDILKKIEETKAERLERREKALQRKTAEHKEEDVKKQEIKCIIDNETYTIISTAEFSDNKGCHLAKKENGYAVLGYIGNKFIKIQEFETLKSERIAARLSEKLPEGESRYIVRIGLNKFIVNVTEDNIEYLMAL